MKAELADGKFTFQTLFSNSVFFTLIVSLLSTYVLWIFISVVSLDAWHIATSVSFSTSTLLTFADLQQSFQYFLLSPSYINVINVYAFCNVHDVSWGTRAPPPPPSIGTTSLSADGNIDAEISTTSLDLLYSSALATIAVPCPPETDAPLSKKESDEAYYRTFRSYVVLAWMFCNAALVAVILKSGGLERLSVKKQEEVSADGSASSVVKAYLLVVLWSVAGLSAFKFVGAMWYLIGRIVSLLAPFR